MADQAKASLPAFWELKVQADCASSVKELGELLEKMETSFPNEICGYIEERVNLLQKFVWREVSVVFYGTEYESELRDIFRGNMSEVRNRMFGKMGAGHFADAEAILEFQEKLCGFPERAEEVLEESVALKERLRKEGFEVFTEESFGETDWWTYENGKGMTIKLGGVNEKAQTLNFFDLDWMFK